MEIRCLGVKGRFLTETQLQRQVRGEWAAPSGSRTATPSSRSAPTVDPTTLLLRNPENFTLVEADASPEAGALAVLDIQIPPGNGQVYRALPVDTLFGGVPGKEHD